MDEPAEPQLSEAPQPTAGPPATTEAETPRQASKLLLDGSVAAYFWSPDARTIAALLMPASGTDVAAFPAQPAVARPGPVGLVPGLGAAAQAEQPTLRLVFIDVASGALRSEHRVGLPTGIITQFLPFFDQYAQSHRLWSPASDAIVLPILDDGGVSRITIVPAGGGAPRRLADGVAAFWSP